MRLRLIWALVIALLSPRLVYAYTIPSFPSCTAPTGSIRVSYQSGTHGIVGNSSVFTGSDTVYDVTRDTVMQCFCPSEGSSGIQTNWWKVGNLTDQDIRALESRGWKYIPHGDVWGLDNDPYLAENIAYRCAPGSSSTPGSSESNGIGGGEEQGEILGLAATGNLPLIYAIIMSGVLSLLFGVRNITRTHDKRP